MTAAITIHFRKPELTIACIDSLLVDNWSPVLVWDNSEDNGKTLSVVIERFKNDERVIWGHNNQNLGFGKGNNYALKLLGSQGYTGPVLLINNDAIVRPGMYNALHGELKNMDVPSLIAPKIYQDGQEQGWLYYQPWFALVTRRPLPGSFAYLSGCCLLVSRKNNSLPLFDEDFFMYGEDVELSWRWKKNSGYLILLEETWLSHEGSASSGQATESYERAVIISHWKLSRKLQKNHMLALLMKITKLVPLFSRATLRSFRYRSMIPIFAFFQSLKYDSSLKENHLTLR